MTLGERLRDERGLMGKIVVVWLLMLAVLVIAGIDTGSILLNRYRVTSAADNAAFEAATAYKTTQNQNLAYQAALQQVKQQVSGARITKFSVDPKSGKVTLTVVRKAWSLVADRLSFTKKYLKAVATGTSGPPTL